MVSTYSKFELISTGTYGIYLMASLVVPALRNYSGCALRHFDGMTAVPADIDFIWKTSLRLAPNAVNFHNPP